VKRVLPAPLAPTITTVCVERESITSGLAPLLFAGSMIFMTSVRFLVNGKYTLFPTIYQTFRRNFIATPFIDI
jgi:hypothetical protein